MASGERSWAADARRSRGVRRQRQLFWAPWAIHARITPSEKLRLVDEVLIIRRMSLLRLGDFGLLIGCRLSEQNVTEHQPAWQIDDHDARAERLVAHTWREAAEVAPFGRGDKSIQRRVQFVDCFRLRAERCDCALGELYITNRVELSLTVT